MSNHNLMGAINKHTEKYEYAYIASKDNAYSCPDCKQDVILRKGDIRIHHFAHKKTENPCQYYNNPGESQIHKDAKLALQLFLTKNNIIVFLRRCSRCKESHKIELINSHIKTEAKVEYAFIFNDMKKIADIALIEENQIKYIFEVCYRHKTLPETRPEPWFEIDAEDFLFKINNRSDKDIEINCIRSKVCDNCIKKEEQEKERKRLVELKEKERKHLEEVEKKQRIEKANIRREKSAEIIKTLRSQQKKCSKCKSFDRCSKCVDKLWKQHDLILKTFFETQITS